MKTEGRRRLTMLVRAVAGVSLASLGACTGVPIAPPTAGQATATVQPTTAASSAAAIVAATPSATIDGATLSGRIAFSAGSPPNLDVYVVRADGSGLRQVTDDPAGELDPSCSPDGTRLAFRHQTGDDRTSDIYVIGLDGGAARNLSGNDSSPDWGPAWSPDGAWIAWNTALETEVGFDLGLIRADGSSRRVLKPGIFVEYPAWSPDGGQITFMSQVPEEGSQYDVFVMNADGSNVRRLTTAGGSDGWPTWSPDGRQIAFSSERDDCGVTEAPGCLSTGDIGPYHTLYVMAPDGSGQRRLSTVFAQIADWSPDGRYLVFEGRGGLTVLSADGSAIGGIPVGLGEPGFPDWIG